MIKVVFSILVSFIFTFAITVPFIGLLFKFNIRRLSEKNLSDILPGRELKLGTPIMGGFVIIASAILFTSLFLTNWIYLPAVLGILILGMLFGGIDEYVNTLGKTFFAVRKIRGKNGFSHSLFPVIGVFRLLKKVALFPWKKFEAVLEVSGSVQKGLRNSHKFAMYFLLVIIPIIFLIINNHQTYSFLPLIGFVDLGILYYLLIAFLLIFFGVGFGITDGMDGLSAGLHTFTFITICAVASFFGKHEVALVSAILIGAELSFLYFNVKPARVQMSDVGTLPLGVLFVFLTSLIHMELILFFIGFIYALEISSSLIQQWSVKLFKRRVFLVAPIHHHFERLGWEESKIVERAWLIGGLTCIVGLFIALL